MTVAQVLAVGVAATGLRSRIDGHLRRALLATREDMRPAQVRAGIKSHARLGSAPGCM